MSLAFATAVLVCGMTFKSPSSWRVTRAFFFGILLQHAASGRQGVTDTENATASQQDTQSMAVLASLQEEAERHLAAGDVDCAEVPNVGMARKPQRKTFSPFK